MNNEICESMVIELAQEPADIATPLQQLFDECLNFISITDFEQ